MRNLQRAVGTSFVIAATGAAAWGCFFHFEDDCERSLRCNLSLVTPDACVPSKNDAAVGDECGVFASDSGGDDSTGDGTKQNPYKTLGKAFAQASGEPVYACSETFAEAVVLSTGSALYGGLDCTKGWVYGGDTARTTIQPEPDQTPITLSGSVETTTVANVVARTANVTISGSSSVAVKAEQDAVAELIRCDLFAGNGAAGIGGMSGDPNGMPATGGQDGNPGGMACTADAVTGGAQTITDCGVMSIGGGGGNGEIVNGGNGTNGSPDLGLGQAGTGEPAMDPMGNWSCGVGTGLGGGNTGKNGAPGESGTGATGLAMLTASGYMGVAGGDGKPGTPGQGGGGGGGAKGGMACSGSTKGGASGGSGGSGGCGGLPGKGGGPGGASIGLISFNAKLTLTDCTITAGNGGSGGTGGDLQPGGLGGSGGVGGMPVGALNAGCNGGDGGRGGNGGPGGGGLGGPSIGIAHTGLMPEKRGMTTISTGTPGTGGLGGNMDSAGNHGANGTAIDVQPF